MTPTTCTDCGRAPVVTRTGHCVICAEDACDHGDGDRVGLPVPATVTVTFDDHGVMTANADAVVEAINAHFDRLGDAWEVDFDADPVVAFANHTCGECGAITDEMTDAERDAHVLYDDEWVLIDCEGHVSALARAAAVEAEAVAR